ncbi:hypothetical protein [Streptomyces sp. NPDC050507]|uniref:hypothetical protein n=1 Tax=Streptomyces sp. NPDC050507 TaxID=3365619 RepID=UPI00378850DB
MEPEVMAGWIGGLAGLGGAVVGAGGALLGGRLQHRQQAETARRERWEGFARAATEATLNELLKMQEEMTDWSTAFTGAGEQSQELYHMVLKRGRAARHATLLIPEATELRARLQAICAVMTDYQASSPRPGEFEVLSRFAWSYTAAQEGIEVLASFLRHEPLPPPTAPFINQESQRVAYRAQHPLPGS